MRKAMKMGQDKKTRHLRKMEKKRKRDQPRNQAQSDVRRTIRILVVSRQYCTPYQSATRKMQGIFIGTDPRALHTGVSLDQCITM
jgi:hypothetical protein